MDSLPWSATYAVHNFERNEAGDNYYFHRFNAYLKISHVHSRFFGADLNIIDRKRLRCLVLYNNVSVMLVYSS